MNPKRYLTTEKSNGRRPNLLRVLTYHRVAGLNDRSMLDPRLISATPEKFERQMRFLASRYQVISMVDVLDAIEQGTYLPDRAILITFDDAYFDFTEYAWPILKQLNLPATIFVPTSYPDQPDRAFWWDRLHYAFVKTSRDELRETPVGTLPLGTYENKRQSLRRLQDHLKTRSQTEVTTITCDICDQLDRGWQSQKSILSWDELRHLTWEGVTIGAHTRTHSILTHVSLEQARQEIVGSQQDLKEEIGTALPIFSYPDGAHNEAIIKILEEEGFVLAFTTTDGQNDLNAQAALRLYRNNVGKRSSMPIFRLRLSRYGKYVDKWRRRKQ